MRQFMASLRGRLFLISTAAVLGLLIGLYFQITSYQSTLVRDTERLALTLASVVAAQHRMHFEGIEAMLRTIALDPVIRDGLAEQCTRRFAQIEQELVEFGFARLGATNNSGQIYCSGTEMATPHDHSDWPYFLNVMERQRFSLGTYRFGPLSQETIVIAAHPIFDEADTIRNIVVAGISTAWLNKLLEDVSPHDDALFQLIDEAGFVVARYPAEQSVVGESLAETELFERIQLSREGTVEQTSSDGLSQIVGFVPLGDEIGRLSVATYLPAPSPIEWLAHDSTIPYLTMIAVVAVGVAGVGFSIHHTILRGVRQISGISRQLANGDLTARVGLPHHTGEFGTLAKNLDDMAIALEHRGRKIDHYTRRLEEVNKDLEHFAYIASHDLRAPLRGIDNLVQWIEEDLDDRLTDESRFNMQRLRQRVDRLDRLMDGLLQYSRAGRSKGDVETFHTGALVTETAGLVDPPEGFVINVDNDMPLLTTSRVALQTVFANLIGNALKHHDRDHGRIRVSAGEQGSLTEFTIMDDGPGIPEHARDRIFDIFQTLDAKVVKPGSGIGLAIVKRLVETHGGTIDAEPPPESDRGAIFRFTWAASPHSI